MNYGEESLKLHGQWKGKIEVVARVPVGSREELSLAYTPGVAEPCMAIHEDVNKSFELTRRWNTVPVITDGTAVLGLGDIGPEAGMPVMEGKCALFLRSIPRMPRKPGHSSWAPVRPSMPTRSTTCWCSPDCSVALWMCVQEPSTRK